MAVDIRTTAQTFGYAFKRIGENMLICIGCDHRDDVIEHHAKIIAQLKREKMAYRAALIEIAGDVDYKTVLLKHMERLDA